MREELDVISDEGRVVVYTLKDEAVSKLNIVIRQKNTAIEARIAAEKAMRQSDGRLAALRTVIERILDDVSPGEKAWAASISTSDLNELRGMLDLKADAA